MDSSLSGAQPPVVASALGRRFGKVAALAGVDLTVAAGERLGLVGPDGAGKSTLLQLMAALLDPGAGRCRVLGFDTLREAAKIQARIGYMAQGFTLYERLSVDENLAFAARVRGVTGDTYRERRAALLAMAGLEPFAARRERDLSGGMRKKLALCTNLIHEPPLLLLDEPGLGVDPLSRRELWQMLDGLRARGVTLVVATSYMDEAERCDRVAFLDRGRLLALDTPAALRARAAGTTFTVTRTAGGALPPATLPGVRSIKHLPDRLRVQLEPGRNGSAAQRLLAPLGTVQAVEADLEDVFTLLAPPGEDVATAARPAHPARPVAAAPGAGGISTQGLSRRYGAFSAVDAVSLDIPPGEIFGLLGANGAGKTTLIKLLCGLERPSAGSATIAGIALDGARGALHRAVGYMSQRFSLYPDLSVAENLRFFASAQGLAGRRARAAIAAAAAESGLDAGDPRMAGALSGALRQRLALACAVLHRPQVLFLDEPTSGVDPLSRHRFWALIRNLAAAGMTVVVTTHYLEEAAFCQRLGLMQRGRLIASGTLAALRAQADLAADAGVEAIFLAHLGRPA
ncbi:ATP-binding cassette domain-containing protein [Pseudomonas aeruginosa]|uniref:ATP-binding cassette domain-containing protein n=1 Tax=Pseudomonas aeruginosa TaxID=287 RepID=UPI000AAD47AF|nr:ATP-binding cassette domain-containing protein [Pseudomonas aeruginosa]EIZ0539843.1 ABC transporter ATP-binding protein [Pseudomonas aeruginosa]EKV4130260.1 ABC transporter ATP-binding protein [Pseudomonas aeruginosa]EKW1417656.1 ABC transporter ATP-binding protein [Pseudomonas aeruginosa]EKW1534901.1 ABC transporter ATP-binding protein [Pseudomonas aeruginosa]ELQ7977237.1 ABC transporter ATP-binding protein [Pseudomonas aeruginosa]